MAVNILSYLNDNDKIDNKHLLSNIDVAAVILSYGGD